MGDFIAYLKKKNLLENTIFYIYPDHQMMGNGDHIAKLASLGRGLYLLTNAKVGDAINVGQASLKQYSIPRMILNGAEIKSNVKFPADFPGVQLSNSVAVASLNSAISSVRNFKNTLHVQVNKNLILMSDSQESATVEIDKETKWVNFIFNQEMRFIKALKGNADFVPFEEEALHKQPLQLTVFLKDYFPGSIYFGNYKNVGSLQSNGIRDNNLYLTSSFIEKIIKENKLAYKNLKYNPKMYALSLHLKSIGDQADITSTEYVTLLNGGPNSKIRLGDKYFKVERGINLIYWDKDRFVFKNYDTYGSQEHSVDLIRKLEMLHIQREPYVMAASDSLGTSLNGYKDRLGPLGLNLLGMLNGRVAYIGYYDGTRAFEYTDPKSVSKVITLLRKDKEWVPPKASNLKEYLGDNGRFIAHAGGAISGKTYTNSLDALNNSYAKGLKLFELDISETSDGYYVAAHDWQHWSNITGYKGNLPPNRETFLKQKIYENFTPLDMDGINQWFKVHPDAILVTDKINEPKKFSNQFIDKKRLMMELFDVNSVVEGIEAGILASMPTGDMWDDILNNHYDLIKDKKIKYVAASRKLNMASIAIMLNEGIKIFAFHINFEKHATEKWVACNERNLFYGMYVDNPDFRSMNQCD